MVEDPLIILILDDNASDYELMKRELRSACPGAIIEWASSKRTFNGALDRIRPTIALLDYTVPGFDGLSAMALLNERYPDVPAIVVSGGIGEETAIHTLKAGATDYVLKKHLDRLGPVVVRALQEIEESNERQRIEEELSVSRRRFESLFYSSNEGICLHEMVYDDTGIAVDYRIVDVNPSYESITGIPRSRAVGALASDLYGSPEPPYMDIYLKVVVTGESTHFETWYAPMEKHFHISVISPMEGQFFTIFMDMTERKNLESQLKKKADDLSRSNAELQQFAYVASHDLQEPLRMISAYLDLLKKRHGDRLPEEALQYLEAAFNGSQRMKALISDLLTYSRLDSRGHTNAPVDLNQSVKRILQTMQTTIEDNGAHIECSTLPTVMADQSQISQLLQNLISNAIKFRGDDPPRILIDAEEGNGHWTIRVKDNGIGINPTYSDRIFQMFQRLHTQHEYPGTGIGLAICKKIVERHGGTIWVESKEGEGSTFFFTIPC